MSSTTSFICTGNLEISLSRDQYMISGLSIMGPEFLITRTFLLHAWTLMLLPGNFYNMR